MAINWPNNGKPDMILVRETTEGHQQFHIYGELSAAKLVCCQKEHSLTVFWGQCEQ